MEKASGGVPGGRAAAPAGAPPRAGRSQPILVLQHAAKSFGAVQALLDGSIELYPGEAHALVGENGAGKSTLVKILAGVYQPDAGLLLVDRQEVTLHGPAAAHAAGISVIYQEPALFPDLTVAENMFIGRQPSSTSPSRFLGRRIDRRAMRAEAAAIFGRLGVQLDPARIARGLSIADQQVVEIGKAISLEARVIVMDEPTAALSAAEVDRLFDVVRTLRAAGTAILFISHRLEEMFALCQRVTVMRDGKQVLTRELKGANALIVSATDPTALSPTLNAAMKRGITVVTYDSDAPTCRNLFINQASTAQIGTSEVDVLAKQLKQTGDIAIVSATASATNQNAWIGYMKQELKKYPKMKLVSTVYGNDDPTTATQVTQGLLQQYPNLMGIISPTTVGIAAAAAVLDTAKYRGKIALTGLGTPDSLKKYVSDGTIKEFVLWKPNDLGYLAGYAAVEVASGKLNGSQGQTFTAGKLGSYTVGADKTVLLGPPFVFTPANIGQFNF